MPTRPQPHNYEQRQAIRKANSKAYERHRGSARERGYTTAWDKYSKARLAEHPICVMCKAEGRIVEATVTDHIKPARRFPELFWDPTNHQSLCLSHNVSKAAEDEKRYGKAPQGGGLGK